ncbi:MAG: hypothetical protein H6839_12535 [Planctomycetes bacterium]|nr:hypothetical protein [Planctomycetota bacterium]
MSPNKAGQTLLPSLNMLALFAVLGIAGTTLAIFAVKQLELSHVWVLPMAIAIELVLFCFAIGAVAGWVLLFGSDKELPAEQADNC